jgi:hypothetical protein
MEEILIEVIREQRAGPVILSELGRQTGPRSIFKLMSFMTCTVTKRYSDYIILKENDMWRGCIAMGESEVVCGILKGRPEERRPLVRPKHR